MLNDIYYSQQQPSGRFVDGTFSFLDKPFPNYFRYTDSFEQKQELSRRLFSMFQYPERLPRIMLVFIEQQLTNTVHEKVNRHPTLTFLNYGINIIKVVR